jgi:hypothetical protein
MQNIQKGLKATITNLPDKDWEKSLTYFRLWSEVGQTHFELPADLIFDTIYENRASGSSNYTPIYPKASAILRLIDDIESDPTLAAQCAGFRSRFCAKILKNFFDNDMTVVHANSGYGSVSNEYYADVNYIAHCANFGYLGENTIRTQILQSLISHARVYEHQLTALAILFKIAGATFNEYAGPTVINRCFEVFDSHQYSGWGRGLVRDVLELRKSGWKGLPPHPIFATGKGNLTGARGPPIATSR